jgi:NADH-quinone oxidoreductase subunit M
MWPVHTWLPDAHVEAPTAGSVILAGILLKMGGYGFIRFSLPMFPLASAYFTPLIFALSAIAIIYTSFVALAQTDMKKLIAYSSVAHMGFVTMGLFALTSEAVQGAMVQMLSHGLVSAALFLVVGVVYDRLHTRDIDRYGGLVGRMPAYAFVFMVFMLASIGLPGTSGFVGEFLILLGTFRVSTLECFLAATALFLSTMYMLYLYRRVIFGTITREDLRNIVDLSPREKAVFAPLLVLVLWMGLYPSSFLTPIRASVDHLVQQASAAIKAQQRAELDTASIASLSSTVIPAKARIHPSAVREADQWVPAFAGTTN